MLDKEQLIAGTKCDEVQSIGGCIDCKMPNNDNCVVDIATTALQYRDVLEKIEWSVIAGSGNNARCPMCNGLKTEGHKENCNLALVLK